MEQNAEKNQDRHEATVSCTVSVSPSGKGKTNHLPKNGAKVKIAVSLEQNENSSEAGNQQEKSANQEEKPAVAGGRQDTVRSKQGDKKATMEAKSREMKAALEKFKADKAAKKAADAAAKLESSVISPRPANRRYINVYTP